MNGILSLEIQTEERKSLGPFVSPCSPGWGWWGLLRLRPVPHARSWSGMHAPASSHGTSLPFHSAVEVPDCAPSLVLSSMHRCLSQTASPGSSGTVCLGHVLWMELLHHQMQWSAAAQGCQSRKKLWHGNGGADPMCMHSSEGA